MHPDVLDDPLHVLAAPGQEQDAVRTLIQPGSKGGNDLGEPVGDVDILLGDAGFFLNERIQGREIYRFDQGGELILNLQRSV
ncbi:hypothetical protein D3C81_1346220 [compost metagenome]